MTLLRYGYLAGFLVCAALLGAAFYFEIILYMDPCPLCMLQRLVTALIGVGCLLAFILDRFQWPLRFSLALVIASSIFGIFVADHHLWLQSLPPEEVPACGPGFYYMLDTMPMSDLLDVMLHGDGNCAEVSWRFFGLSMPGWTMVFFIAFGIAGLLSLLATWHKTARR